MKFRELFSPPQTLVIALLLLGCLAIEGIARSKPQAELNETPLVDFPLSIDGWKGVSLPLEVGIAEFLELSDYILASFRHNDSSVNLYIAYYESLKEGTFPHSPKLCIPGGGWEIERISEIEIGDNEVRRVVIEKNNLRQIVYYWYQQESELVADEYALKWNTFMRVVRDGRSDTSLVRLAVQIREGEDEARADAILVDFYNTVKPKILERLG